MESYYGVVVQGKSGKSAQQFYFKTPEQANDYMSEINQILNHYAGFTLDYYICKCNKINERRKENFQEYVICIRADNGEDYEEEDDE